MIIDSIDYIDFKAIDKALMFYNGSTFYTNFHIDCLPFYISAIDIFEKEVNHKVFKIKNIAYDCNGITVKNNYSLHYCDKHIKDDRSISMKRFWDIYDKIKT